MIKTNQKSYHLKITTANNFMDLFPYFIKITKERTPESEEENVEWETNRDGEFQKSLLI